MYLNENLKYLRKINNLNQEDIADKLGFKSYTTISKWEEGVSSPNIRSLIELSNIYDVSIDTMININLSKNPYVIDKWKQFIDNENTFQMLIELHDIASRMNANQVEKILSCAVDIMNEKQ